MKRFLVIATLVALAVGPLACRRPQSSTSLNYEVKAMEQGKQGTVLFKVYSYGYTNTQALDRAKMDAVHAVLFKGIPGSNSQFPLVPLETLNANQKYFQDFFGGVEGEISQYSLGVVKVKEGARQGPYRIYVSESGDGSIEERAKVGSMIKIGIPVAVNLDALRKKLEDDGIVRRFGL